MSDGNGVLSATTKPSNPKDAIGSSKLPMSLVPSSAIAAESLALLDGALKYGRANWRAAGVRASIYIDAAFRHLHAYLDGEELTTDSAVEHLAAVRACCAILIDAGLLGKVTDDRPPRGPLPEHLDRLNERAAEMIARYEGKPVPHHWTINDNLGE